MVTLAIIAILRADNSSQYQLSFQTGVRSALHNLRPRTKLGLMQIEFGFANS